MEPLTEYRITEVYLPTMKGNARKRGTVYFRTDARGRVWIKGAGRPEDASLTEWFANHPRLERIGRY